MDHQTSIYVTQPSMPPLDEFVDLLHQIWNSKCLTNSGPFHQKFETALAEHLGVPYVSLFCNGMVALQVGLQALGISGKVITTPYSFPATTHAVYWNHCTPVFCDIESQTFNLDPAKIEPLITPETTCILPVHVYGNPCDVATFSNIAEKHNLAIFYDAAHAFGVEIGNTSILEFGDLSMLSFHATKVFNTIEGGALITKSPELKTHIDFLKNFGFAGETTVIQAGTNGKMNELQAAYGLLQLRYIDGQIEKRKRIADTYRRELAGISGLRYLENLPGVTHNYSYFPLLVDEEEFGVSRDELYERLKNDGIFGRRYFFPLISSFPMYDSLPSAASENLPVARRIAEQVLCLPIYAALEEQTAMRIAETIGRLA